MAVNSQFLWTTITPGQTYTVPDNGFNKVKIIVGGGSVNLAHNTADFNTNAYISLGGGLNQIDLPLSPGETLYLQNPSGSMTNVGVSLIWYNDDKSGGFTGTINLTTN